MFTNSDFELAFCLSHVLVITDFAYIPHFGWCSYLYVVLIGSICICTFKIFSFVEYFWDRTVSVFTDCLLGDCSHLVYDGYNQG